MEVKIYSTPECPYCKMAKKFLTEKGVEYEDLNVADDEKAREEMIEKSGQMGVPVLDINGTIIVGFDQPKIEQALGSEGSKEMNTASNAEGTENTEASEPINKDK